MRLTLRAENDRYVDILIDPTYRELTFLSPIPDLTLEDLCKIADDTQHVINLPITGDRIVPDKAAVSNDCATTLKDLLRVICYLDDYVISES